MNQTLGLYRLQLIDTKIVSAQAHLQEILKKKEDDALTREAGARADEAGKKLASERTRMHQIEAEVADQRIKIEQSESSLYSGRVHNPKELQDLENEVASLKRHLATLEDRLLEAMLSLEEAEKSEKSTQADLHSAEERWSSENVTLNSEQSALEKELQTLSTERSALAGSISAEDRLLYDQLRQQRRGLAVTTISDNSCDACGSKLTPALAQMVRSALQLARCPSCGRILFGN